MSKHDAAKGEVYWAITKSSDISHWNTVHQEVANLIASGWTLQASHAVTDATGLVVYFFLTRIKQEQQI